MTDMTDRTPLSGPAAACEPNADPAEVARFAALADRWWDADGEFRPLHQIGPARLAFVRQCLTQSLVPEAKGLRPLSGLRILDIGSGGGLVSEPLARLGANVTGIDLASESVAAAGAHAKAQGLSIDYRVQSIEALAASGERFDAAICLEVLEHVPDPAAFLSSAALTLEPGGVLIVSTINRTAKSYALAIVGAEYVLGWLPRGTHQWERFLTPEEVEQHFHSVGLLPLNSSGIVYEPLRGRWSLGADQDVNFIAVARKPDAA